MYSLRIVYGKLYSAIYPDIFPASVSFNCYSLVWVGNNLYYRDVENLLRFVTDSEVDATNNISERELRHLVIIRKISNGSRSPRGANATAMLLSIIQTLRLNKQNVLRGLQNILKNPSGW